MAEFVLGHSALVNSVRMRYSGSRRGTNVDDTKRSPSSGEMGRQRLLSGIISPCHNGLFSIDGEVLGGPPPRPFDQFQTKIENRHIRILLA